MGRFISVKVSDDDLIGLVDDALSLISLAESLVSRAEVLATFACELVDVDSSDLSAYSGAAMDGLIDFAASLRALLPHLRDAYDYRKEGDDG